MGEAGRDNNEAAFSCSVKLAHRRIWTKPPVWLCVQRSHAGLGLRFNSKLQCVLGSSLRLSSGRRCSKCQCISSSQRTPSCSVKFAHRRIWTKPQGTRISGMQWNTDSFVSSPHTRCPFVCHLCAQLKTTACSCTDHFFHHPTNNCTTSSQLSPGDCEAWVDIWDGLNGPDWGYAKEGGTGLRWRI